MLTRIIRNWKQLLELPYDYLMGPLCHNTYNYFIFFLGNSILSEQSTPEQ